MPANSGFGHPAKETRTRKGGAGREGTSSDDVVQSVKGPLVLCFGRNRFDFDKTRGSLED